ncbi:MAG: pyruvate ferredoxin oxidoreductase [Candidatus Glassbacteria bacterium]|nr:pyruvate ferredoxin oxidoreductase [Candidatus Glassbacteria bacterium]
MTEIRIHGRGGQGAVAAAHVLAISLFAEGKWVQAFPHFGVERRGAPVAAFVRFDTDPIELRCHIYHPDYVIVLDPTLCDTGAVTEGLAPGASVLLNSDADPVELEKFKEYRIATVDASSIAIGHKLGSPASPIVNTAILGAFARFSELVSLESLIESIGKLIKRKTESNIAAVRESYEKLRVAVSS